MRAIPFLLLLLSLSTTPAGSGHAADDAEARTLIGQLEQEAVAMASASVPMAEKERRFRQLLQSSFDLPGIARFILGRQWQAASPNQRTDFLRLFEDITVDTWVPRFRDYGGERLDITAIQPTDDEIMADTALHSPRGPQRSISWRLNRTAAGLKVADIIVDGISMTVTLRSEYGSIMRQTGGLAGLIDRMRQQVAATPHQ